jgi:hypothetical protein
MPRMGPRPGPSTGNEQVVMPDRSFAQLSHEGMLDDIARFPTTRWVPQSSSRPLPSGPLCDDIGFASSIGPPGECQGSAVQVSVLASTPRFRADLCDRVAQGGADQATGAGPGRQSDHPAPSATGSQDRDCASCFSSCPCSAPDSPQKRASGKRQAQCRIRGESRATRRGDYIDAVSLRGTAFQEITNSQCILYSAGREEPKYDRSQVDLLDRTGTYWIDTIPEYCISHCQPVVIRHIIGYRVCRAHTVPTSWC